MYFSASVPCSPDCFYISFIKRCQEISKKSKVSATVDLYMNSMQLNTFKLFYTNSRGNTEKRTN